MHWKLKAAIQNGVSRLPSEASYAAYYWIQRHFGGLRKTNPLSRLASGVETWNRIRELQVDPRGKVFFEVGTGRMALAPLAYWLLGAEKTITVDLNPYLKAELIRESLAYMTDNLDEIRELFGDLIDERRLDQLSQFSHQTPFTIDAFLRLAGIEYIAPGDATETRLPQDSIDFHTSYTVFEHIPSEVLAAILAEGNRIIRDDGLFVHRIDYSDHFAHADKSISAINFLQFSDTQWSRLAGNRYMYMNRLRHDDYLELFRAAGHHIEADIRNVEPELKAVLRRTDFHLNERFASKSEETLSITGSWIVSRKL